MPSDLLKAHLFNPHVGHPNLHIGFRRRALLEKGFFQESPFSRDSRDSSMENAKKKSQRDSAKTGNPNKWFRTGALNSGNLVQGSFKVMQARLPIACPQSMKMLQSLCFRVSGIEPEKKKPSSPGIRETKKDLYFLCILFSVFFCHVFVFSAPDPEWGIS